MLHSVSVNDNGMRENGKMQKYQLNRLSFQCHTGTPDAKCKEIKSNRLHLSIPITISESNQFEWASDIRMGLRSFSATTNSIERHDFRRYVY